jgi:dinuclear metal center YbgI/SA1388 family protein
MSRGLLFELLVDATGRSHYNTTMLLEELDNYFRNLLQIDELAGTDASLNGIQVGNSGKDIRKIAFGVDACMDTFQQAARWGADMLFVHHGLFWGAPVPISGMLYKRIRFLMEHDMALYAAHLPLDKHPQVGNNAGLIELLGLTETQPFGDYKGFQIGFKGRFQEPQTIDQVLQMLGRKREECLGIFPFGPERITTVGVVSGGATTEARDALQEGLDLFLTGEISHQVYHECLEGGLNLIGGGHYFTEIWGVQRVAKKLTQETGIETRFIDVPTGL